MLLDRHHRRWAAWTALAAILSLVAFWLLARQSPDGWTGGSRPGLLFGIAGGVLMLLTAILGPLRYLPGWAWIGTRQTWVRLHIWLGSLSGLVILCHSGFRLGGLFEQVLYALLFLTLVSGVVGVALQQFLPGLMTRRVAPEVPYDQIPHVCRQMVVQADIVAKELEAANLPAETRGQMGQFYERLVRPFLQEPRAQRTYLVSPAKLDEAFAKVQGLPGAEPTRARLDQLRTYCDERRLLDEQERLQFWLHAWLYVHVPVSYAMLVLAGAHAVMALYY